MEQFGYKDIVCSHKDITKAYRFYITGEKGKTMLSLNTSQDLELITLNCSDINMCSKCHMKSDISEVKRQTDRNSKSDATKDLLKRYKSCFQGVGLFPGEYHIHLREGAIPVIHPPRRVPEALKDKVRKELDRMIDLDILEKVDIPTDWVNIIVYVTKPSGELRMCLDPKDLNK